MLLTVLINNQDGLYYLSFYNYSVFFMNGEW